MNTLDEFDRKILEAMQQDGRLTIVQLSEQVGLSTTPCQRRLKRLEEEGYIKGYTAVIDPLKLNYQINVFVSVKLERQAEDFLERFEDSISKLPEVMESYLMSGGGRDYMLRVVAKDLLSYERFLVEHLARIPGVANIDTSFSIKQVLARSSLPID
ncbi:MAG: Lrp/AsnC family transcriptional regulator [Kordiimonas sp.]